VYTPSETLHFKDISSGEIIKMSYLGDQRIIRKMNIVTSCWKRKEEYFVIMDDEFGSVFKSEPKIGLKMFIQSRDDDGNVIWKDEFDNVFLEHVDIDVWMGGNAKMISDEANRLSKEELWFRNAFVAEKNKNNELEADNLLLKSKIAHIEAYSDMLSQFNILLF